MLQTLRNKVDISALKDYGDSALNHLKGYGNTALYQAKRLGTKRVKVAGHSINPFIIGAAVAAIGVGTYLLVRSRNRRLKLADETGMGE